MPELAANEETFHVPVLCPAHGLPRFADVSGGDGWPCIICWWTDIRAEEDSGADPGPLVFVIEGDPA